MLFVVCLLYSVCRQCLSVSHVSGGFYVSLLGDSYSLVGLRGRPFGVVFTGIPFWGASYIIYGINFSDVFFGCWLCLKPPPFGGHSL